MKNRIEDKYILSIDDYFNIKNNIKNDFNKIFEDRIVSSIYFDTRDYKFFNESEEGLIPRMKVRKRTYNYNDKKIFFEIKISDIKFDKKYTVNFNKPYNSNTYLVKKNFELIKANYLIETCNVKYNREYYQRDNGERITFDSKLEYQNSKKNKKYFDKKIILEHKYNMSNFSRNLFFKQKSRFSKYSEALLNTVF